MNGDLRRSCRSHRDEVAPLMGWRLRLNLAHRQSVQRAYVEVLTQMPRSPNASTKVLLDLGDQGDEIWGGEYER